MAQLVFHSPRSFGSRVNSHPFLTDGLSCNYSATVICRLNTLHIVIRKVNLLEPFWNPATRMERMVRGKAYIEEDIEGALCGHDTYVPDAETSLTVRFWQSVVWFGHWNVGMCGVWPIVSLIYLSADAENPAFH